MENIFKNAYFCKPYKTRDGRKAFYIHHYKDSESDDMYYLIIDGSVVTYVWGADGKIAPNYNNDGLDIVSEWQPISEEELDELARADADKYCIPNTSEWNTRYTAFKAGCHLIMEEQL